ncbi:MAG: response regulator transcription factor [Treponema sp.]|nr:response regulator transcription factor [Treponema sp.]
MKILVIEDDKGITDYLIPELKHEGFETVTANTGRQGIEMFQNEKPDLILLDVMLPELNGIEVLRRIREVSNVPIILETARGETIDKINGLNAGADDYIAKPFEIEELIARINAILRRVNTQDKTDVVLRCRDLEMNTQSMNVKIGDKQLYLSKTEYFLLKLFLENVGKVISRDEILDAIWGKEHFIDENIVDVYIGYLRSKIADVDKSEYIKTVRGIGYIVEN